MIYCLSIFELHMLLYVHILKWFPLLLRKSLGLIATKVAVGRMEDLEGQALTEKHLY